MSAERAGARERERERERQTERASFEEAGGTVHVYEPGTKKTVGGPLYIYIVIDLTLLLLICSIFVFQVSFAVRSFQVNVLSTVSRTIVRAS